MATDAARLGKARTGEQTREEQAEEKQDQPAIQRVWEEPKGIWGVLTAVGSIVNGERMITVAFLFFLLGGINAALMRIQLAQPNNTFVTPEQYNQLFTMHGSTMLFLFAVPFMEGAALLLLPLALGARTVPWPRLTAFVFWTFLIGGLLFQVSWLFGAAPDAGWTAYAPLSEKAFSPNSGLDFWLLALLMISVGGIFASAILMATVFTSRAPGMSIHRMPLFGWAALVMSAAMFFAFIALFCGCVFLEFDRKFGTRFYDPDGGGSPLLWQYLFWILGHPAVYIQFIPAAGITSMALPVIIRERVSGYRLLVAAFVIAGLLSFGLWTDQTLVAALSPLAMTVLAGASVLFAIVAAIAVSAWLAMIARGAGKWNTAYLFILGFLFLFILGVITGVMLALYPFDAQMHGSLFVVAHLHYYLFGTVVFPIFAGMYYWFPKFKGRLLDERLGKWNFWLMFIGANAAFFPMYLLGLLGMARRMYTYPSVPEWNTLNLISSIGGVTIAVGVLFFLYNIVSSLLPGEQATANPWSGDSLEWATDSPVPAYGFQRIPTVQSRHPLWEPERVDRGGEKIVHLVERLAEWPTTWRAALVTSARSGEPQEVYRVAGPSVWPFVAVIGMTLVLISFFFDQLVFLAVFLLGVIVLILSLIGWHRRTKEEDSVPSAELDEFENSYAVPIYAHGSPGISLWATMLTLLGFGAALAVAIFAYSTLRSSAPVWPPDGIARPDRSVPLIATGVIIAAQVLMLLAVRAGGSKRPALLKLGLGVGFILDVAFLVLQVKSYVVPPLSPTTNAYGSIFYAVAFLMSIIAVVGLFILLGTIWFVWRAYHGTRDAYRVRNAVAYWSFAVIAWLAVLTTLYLTV